MEFSPSESMQQKLLWLFYKLHKKDVSVSIIIRKMYCSLFGLISKLYEISCSNHDFQKKTIKISISEIIKSQFSYIFDNAVLKEISNVPTLKQNLIKYLNLSRFLNWPRLLATESDLLRLGVLVLREKSMYSWCFEHFENPNWLKIWANTSISDIRWFIFCKYNLYSGFSAKFRYYSIFGKF